MASTVTVPKVVLPSVVFIVRVELASAVPVTSLPLLLMVAVGFSGAKLSCACLIFTGEDWLPAASSSINCAVLSLAIAGEIVTEKFPFASAVAVPITVLPLLSFINTFAFASVTP